MGVRAVCPLREVLVQFYRCQWVDALLVCADGIFVFIDKFLILLLVLNLLLLRHAL